MINNPDRHVAPASEKIRNIKILEGETMQMPSGVNLHCISAGTEVLKADFVFDAGIRKQSQPGIAESACSMLSEGTSTKTAEQIAEELDFFGAYLQTKCTPDDSVVTLYCQSKHFLSCLPYVLDVIGAPTFPEHELAIHRKKQQQKLLVNKRRNSFLSRRLFYSTIFGPGHPYGTFCEAGDYDNISRETLSSFFKNSYLSGIKYVLVSGGVNQALWDSMDNLLRGLPGPPKANVPLPAASGGRQEVFREMPDSVQSALRIGRGLFNRTHPDFQKLQVLNLVLGGYFGSRLMKNIREEKGLTYGIYSVVESFKDGGCFYIDTEINNELRATGIHEIYRELSRLRTDLIPEDELSLARNYLLGSFLRSIDGPFSLADRKKILLDYELSYDYYDRFIDTVNGISAVELRDLANKYFQEADLSEIIVGRQ